MAIRQNRFNDPALGEAFANIASLFAPPSAGDVLNYTNANAKRQEAERVAALWANPNDPMASRRAALTGIQDYGQTPDGFTYKVDQDNATTRYGYDTSAATTLSTNAADNQRATITSLFGPLDQGQVRPAVPAEIAETQGLPGIASAFGAPKPLSETEVKGQERIEMRANGLLTDQMLTDMIFGEQAPVKAATPDGPVFMAPGTAARTGAPAYVDAGSAAKPENGMAQLADGTQVPAIQDITTGRWKHAQTGAELPSDIRVFKTPAPVGTGEQVGVGKPVANNIDRQLIDVAVAKDTAVKLREMIAASPASQGAVGWLRGTAQNVVQTGGEVGAYFGGQIQQGTDAIATGAADASLAGAFDPNIPAIEMMANLLAFQYAKTTTGERLSNEMLRASRAALGLEGLTANQASSLARIDMAIKQMESQEAILQNIRTNGVGAGQPTASVPNGNDGPQPGDVEDGYRFLGGDPSDPSSWEPL